MKLWSAGLVMLFCAQVFAQPAPTHADVAQALDQARATWERANVAEYVYGYNKFCECHAETPPETLVSVAHERVIDVRHTMVRTGDTVVADAKNFDLYWTVDDLFALLERAVRTAASVAADFDPDSGVPRSIYIDYQADLIGDEVDVRVTRFDVR